MVNVNGQECLLPLATPWSLFVVNVTTTYLFFREADPCNENIENIFEENNSCFIMNIKR